MEEMKPEPEAMLPPEIHADADEAAADGESATEAPLELGDEPIPPLDEDVILFTLESIASEIAASTNVLTRLCDVLDGLTFEVQRLAILKAPTDDEPAKPRKTRGKAKAKKTKRRAR